MKNTCKYKGVTKCKDSSKWIATITHNGISYTLGPYSRAMTAHKARNRELTRLRGEEKLSYCKLSRYMTEEIVKYFRATNDNSYCSIAAKFNLDSYTILTVLKRELDVKWKINYNKKKDLEHKKTKKELWQEHENQKIIKALKQYNSSVTDDLKVNI